MTGGSGLYIDAVCKGIDNLPDIDAKIRRNTVKLFEKDGIVALQEKLMKLDPEYYQEVDLNNPKRLLRAIEVLFTNRNPIFTVTKEPATKKKF